MKIYTFSTFITSYEIGKSASYENGVTKLEYPLQSFGPHLGCSIFLLCPLRRRVLNLFKISQEQSLKVMIVNHGNALIYAVILLEWSAGFWRLWMYVCKVSSDMIIIVKCQKWKLPSASLSLEDIYRCNVVHMLCTYLVNFRLKQFFATDSALRAACVSLSILVVSLVFLHPESFLRKKPPK